jgi:hypothetical protein
MSRSGQPRETNMTISFQIFHSSKRRCVERERPEEGERKEEKKMLLFTQCM